jgi:hypothetical protein
MPRVNEPKTLGMPLESSQLFICTVALNIHTDQVNSGRDLCGIHLIAVARLVFLVIFLLA